MQLPFRIAIVAALGLCATTIYAGSASRLAAELDRLMGGAVYISESDSTWRSVVAPLDPAEALTEQTLRAALAIPRGHEVKPWSQSAVSEFWQYYIVEMPYGEAEAMAYLKVKAKMEKALSDVRIFKSGGRVEFTIYLVGRLKNGTIVGLKATSIET